MSPSPPLESWQILDLLTHLVEKSLVVYEETGDGQGRYRLLETARQYARDRLMEADEAEAFRQRHFDHFLALDEETGPRLRALGQEVWYTRWEQEHDNFRAALEWGNDGAAGLRLAGSLSWFWYVRGYYAEGRERLASALARAGATADPAARAKALNGAGNIACSQGDLAHARAYFEESLALKRDSGDMAGVAKALSNLGMVLGEQGDYAQAAAFYEEGLTLHRVRGDAVGIATTLVNRGILARKQGDFDLAHASYQESLDLYRGLGDRRGVGIALVNLGNVALVRGDLPRARALFEETLVLRREMGDRRGTAISLGSLGLLARKEGDLSAARAYLTECLVLFRDLGEQPPVAETLAVLGSLDVAQGHAEKAACLFAAAERLREVIGAPLPPEDRDEYDQDVAKALAALGEPAFSAHWSAGRAMPPEQAVAYALADGDAAP